MRLRPSPPKLRGWACSLQVFVDVVFIFFARITHRSDLPDRLAVAAEIFIDCGIIRERHEAKTSLDWSTFRTWIRDSESEAFCFSHVLLAFRST